MTSHETYREQLLDLAYGELGKREARALRAHLEGCPECRTELSRMTATRSAMSGLPAEPAPERGEAVLLAAAREAVRDRNRPWLPSWVWGASVGVVGVAAVALVAVRLAGVVRPPVAQRDHDALVSRSAQAEVPELSSPAADSASSNAAAAEPAQPAPPPATEAPAAKPFKTVPAPKGDVAKRKEGAPATRGDGTGQLPRSTAGGSSVGDSAVREAAAEPPPRPAPAASAAPTAPAAAPAEAQFAQPPPGAAPEGVLRRSRTLDEREASPGPADDKDLSALEEKREAAAPVVGSAGGAGMKARVAKSATEDAISRYERLRAAGKLRTASATFEDCPGEASRQVETDEEGRVVKVTRRGAIQGAAFQAEQFYGADGQLGAVRYRAGGTSHELRLGAPGADAGAAGVPASLLQPTRAADAGPGAPPRCRE
jgi:anti-sigma factor RsiW